MPGQTTECNLGQSVKQRIQKRPIHLCNGLRESPALTEWDKTDDFQAVGLISTPAVHHARALWLGSSVEARVCSSVVSVSGPLYTKRPPHRCHEFSVTGSQLPRPISSHSACFWCNPCFQPASRTALSAPGPAWLEANMASLPINRSWWSSEKCFRSGNSPLPPILCLPKANIWKNQFRRAYFFKPVCANLGIDFSSYSWL